jgi:hypothetical protein
MVKAIVKILAILFLVIDPIGVLEMILGKEKHEIVANSWLGDILTYHIPIWKISVELKWVIAIVYAFLLIYVLIGMFNNVENAMKKVMKNTEWTLAMMLHSFKDSNQKFETQNIFNSDVLKLNSSLDVSMDVFGTEIPYDEELVRQFAEVTAPLRASKKELKEQGYRIRRSEHRKILRFVRKLKESLEQVSLTDLDDEETLKKRQFEWAMLSLATEIAVHTPDVRALWSEFSDNETRTFHSSLLSNREIEKKLLSKPEIIVFSLVILSSLYLDDAVESLVFSTMGIHQNGTIYLAIILEDNQFVLGIFDSALGHQPNKENIIKEVKKVVRKAKGSLSIKKVFNR